VCAYRSAAAFSRTRDDALEVRRHAGTESSQRRRLLRQDRHVRILGTAYIMLHTLSAPAADGVIACMRYPESSIRECLYANRLGFGIVLYTAASRHSFGTLRSAPFCPWLRTRWPAAPGWLPPVHVRCKHRGKSLVDFGRSGNHRAAAPRAAPLTPRSG